ENLLYIEHTVRNGRVVENHHTAKFRNHFFEQLQPLPKQFSGKICDAGHISAGMGKTLNKAGLDRIGPSSRHDDGNRLGRILCTLNELVRSCYHNNVHLETNQLVSKDSVPIRLPRRIAILEHDVLAFEVAKVTQG